jgi:hypothetical protein
MVVGGWHYGAAPPGSAGGGGPGQTSGSARGEAFVDFTPDNGFNAPVGSIEVVTCSARVTRYNYYYGTGYFADDSMEFWSTTWNAPLSTSAWGNLETMRTNFVPDAEIYQIMTDRSGTGPSNLYEVGGETLLQKVRTNLAQAKSQQLMMTAASSMNDYPKTDTWIMRMTASNLATADQNKPALTVRTIKAHALSMIGASSIQLTDGTHVFMRYTRSTGNISLYYQKVDSASATLIYKIPTTAPEATNYYGLEPGFQSFGLTRDNANNLYVVGANGIPVVGVNGPRLFIVNGFKYNGNYSWSYYTTTTWGESSLTAVTSGRGAAQNFALTWLPTTSNGSYGMLVAVHSRRDQQWGKNQLGVSVMYAGWLVGDPAATTRNNQISFTDPVSVSSNWRPMNSSGTGLDAIPAPGGVAGVQIAGFYQALNNSSVERAGSASVSVPATQIPTKPSFLSASLVNHPHDPDSKVRQVWMGDNSQYYANMIAGVLTVRVAPGTNVANPDALYRSIDFTTYTITGFPSKASLQSSQGWDIIWDNARGGFWIYYVDATAPRNIRKFYYDHVNNTISSSVQVNPSVLGASGSIIDAIRVPRQKTDIRSVLVDVAMRDGALAPVDALTTLRDISNNQAPNPPAIRAVNAFNATTAYNFDWDFTDPNVNDWCSLVEVEIKRVSTGLNVYTSGQVAPTLVSTGVYRRTLSANALSNDTAYQIRMRCYDSVGAVSAWSGYTSFSTSGTGGTVTITSPPEDNPPMNVSSVTVIWNYTNTNPAIVQTGYQAKVYNDATNALLQDSGVVNSTATTRTITGLASDVRVRIEIQVKDSNAAMSGSGVRILTPSYSNPSTPSITTMPMKGYVEVRVTNPPPTGENPVTLSNQIARKIATDLDATYVIIGTCPVNGIFRDYTAASGIDYTYKARGSST